eukprot:COSAG01_NODE_5463_length_4246_cov_39.670364_5_plen_37_part_00
MTGDRSTEKGGLPWGTPLLLRVAITRAITMGRGSAG